MQPSIVMEWIGKADEDLGFVSTSIEYSEYYAQICFHFQQAAEKYLKAFIIANQLDFPRIHDLIELLEICKEDNNEIEDLEEACLILILFISIPGILFINLLNMIGILQLKQETMPRRSRRKS